MAVLRHVFGYASFRGLQEEIVRHVLGGGSGLVLMPTGGGKSLCYQVPALCLPGVAVVVSPLIALMQDQVSALRQAGVGLRQVAALREPAHFPHTSSNNCLRPYAPTPPTSRPAPSHHEPFPVPGPAVG